jgi:AbrB family looped-hinge helix DNA binding protein
MEIEFERKIDELGRVVIPKEVRAALNLKEGSTLKIDFEEGRIILTPVKGATAAEGAR